MGYGIETVVGTYTATAATGAQAYTAASGQSFQVRALSPNTTASVEAIWTNSSATGYTRIRSPRMHDDVIGTQHAHLTGNCSPVALEYYSDEVFSQDTLIVEDYWRVAPAAVQQSMAFQVYYKDVPGIAANFWTWAQVSTAIGNAPVPNQYFGVYVNPISSGTAGQWGAGVAINSSQDVFKANSWYAVIGFVTNTKFTAFSLLGTDLGNLQVGGPGSVDPLLTRRWFPYMEQYTGQPSIPVINSQNKGATLVQISDNTTATTFDLGLIFAYLGPTGA